jgi:hypothetical protein
LSSRRSPRGAIVAVAGEAVGPGRDREPGRDDVARGRLRRGRVQVKLRDRLQDLSQPS